MFCIQKFHRFLSFINILYLKYVIIFHMYTCNQAKNKFQIKNILFVAKIEINSKYQI